MIALMPLPTHDSMFYGPRSSGPGPWPKTTQMGVGVVIREERRDSGAQTCTVTLEAIATDTSCAILEPLSCENPYLAWDRDDAVGAPVDPIMACGSARMCEMSQVPGHDAEIDDFARRLRDTLGPSARVVAARAP
jgi:hypothetical protein